MLILIKIKTKIKKKIGNRTILCFQQPYKLYWHHVILQLLLRSFPVNKNPLNTLNEQT